VVAAGERSGRWWLSCRAFHGRAACPSLRVGVAGHWSDGVVCCPVSGFADAPLQLQAECCARSGVTEPTVAGSSASEHCSDSPSVNVTGLRQTQPPTRAAAEQNYIERLRTLQAEQLLLKRDDDALTSLLRNVFAPRDTATISKNARDLIAAETRRVKEDPETTEAIDDPELSDSEERAVRELKSGDSEVRAHEQAHKAAAGDFATSGASYSYKTGPDGQRYAVAGEVRMRLETGRTPEETIRNMDRATRAANAPLAPSGADRAVAGPAVRMSANARRQLAALRSQGGQNGSPRGARVDVVA
jgi:hypothetical protein